MNPIDSLRQLLSDARNTFEYALEGAILSFTEKISEVMEAGSISKKELARRIGCRPSYITKIFRGNPNLTLSSMVKIADAVGHELEIDLRPKVVDGIQSITLFTSNDENRAESFARFQGSSVQVITKLPEQVTRVESSANREFAIAA